MPFVKVGEQNAQCLPTGGVSILSVPAWAVPRADRTYLGEQLGSGSCCGGVVGQKGFQLDAPHLPKQSKRGQFPARAQRGAHSALGCPFFNSSCQLTLLCPAWGSQGPMQGAAAFPNRNTQLGDKGCRGMNVSGQKQKGNAYEIHLSTNIWSPQCIRHHSVRKCSFIYYLAVLQQVGLFIKAYRIIFKYLSNRLIAPGMSCREFISQSIWEIHGKDQHFNEQGARRGFHFQYSLAVEKRVDGRARSWGWWMAPKRLGPGGLLRNSGFRPKSSLCGSDCICFWNGKQDLEETVWKGNSKRHFQNDVGRAAHSYWCFNKNIGFWDPKHRCTNIGFWDSQAQLFSWKGDLRQRGKSSGPYIFPADFTSVFTYAHTHPSRMLSTELPSTTNIKLSEEASDTCWAVRTGLSHNNKWECQLGPGPSWAGVLQDQTWTPEPLISQGKLPPQNAACRAPCSAPQPDKGLKGARVQSRSGWVPLGQLPLHTQSTACL